MKPSVSGKFEILLTQSLLIIVFNVNFNNKHFEVSQEQPLLGNKLTNIFFYLIKSRFQRVDVHCSELERKLKFWRKIFVGKLYKLSVLGISQL